MARPFGDCSLGHTGDVIAAVGNSDSSSEPHLHIQAQLPGTVIAPYSGAPIPIQINSQYLVRGDRFVVL
jgi:murein DD-endopeptidase MepM/ murein hydrolase activator NlpD